MSAVNESKNLSSGNLADDRRSSRTFGCVGLSVVAHAAFLAALALSSERLPELMGDGGTVSMTDASSAGAIEVIGATDVSAEPKAIAQTMTDTNSEIALPTKVEAAPEKKVVAVPLAPPVQAPPKPVAKPVAKTTPKAAPAAPKMTDTESPVVTEDPNIPKIADVTAETTEPETESRPEAEPQPTLLASPPSDETPAQAEQAPEPVKESTPVAAKSEAASEEPPAASAPTAVETSEASTEASAAAAASSSQASNSSESASSGGGSSGSGSAVTGPIRNSNDLKARQGNPNPVYPARDRLARRQGVVVVLGRVSADGRVTDTKLEKSSGSPLMDAASIQAFKSWRYEPGQAGWVRKPFEFRLVGEAKEVAAPLGKTLRR